MSNELFEKLKSFVKENVNEHRYEHTLGVVDCAVQYAEKFGADVEKARIAAIFHDACKSEGPLDHGPAAAEKIVEFGVEDEEIRNAIRFHTVGRANMSLLEMVVKAADLTDRTRSYPKLEHYRERLRTEDDIRPVMLEMMLDNKAVIEARGQSIAQSSRECIEWLQSVLNKRSNMDNKELALLVAQQLDGKKADDILIVDIAVKSGFADYLILATAATARQIDALKDDIEDKLAEQGLLVKGIEGRAESGWVLMDFGDLIINLFNREQRDRYQLEKVWGDCDTVEFTPDIEA